MSSLFPLKYSVPKANLYLFLKTYLILFFSSKGFLPFCAKF